MPALLSLLGPLAGKLFAGLVVVIALLATYFGIKRKGTLEERERNQATRQKEVQAAQAQVTKATAKDIEIDKQVAEKVKQIEAVKSSPIVGDKFRF